MRTFFQVLFLLNAAWTLARGDADVSCQLGQSCTLPCSFPAGDETVIHWIQMTSPEKPAHSFYYNTDQLQRQHQGFRGRTSLSKEQISRGNASLLLSGVTVEDEGRYKCYSSVLAGNRESFINLKAYALVQDVHIQHSGKEIICSSDGIYPEPTLTWRPHQTDSNTSFTQTEQKLYSITSSVPSSDSRESQDVICTVSTPANSRTAVLKPTVHQNISVTEASISCPAVTDATFFIWRFNHSEEIVRGKAGGPHSPPEKWKKHIVESSSEKLTLKHLQPSLTGIYTCEIRNDSGTFIRSSDVLIIEDDNNNNKTTVIIIGVAVAVLVLVAAAIAISIWLKNPKKNKKQKNRKEGMI
uniref:Ig-like domain-containing protein n=1 Tax=Oryzias latipes TaxID=8090 RepID=A0A3P9KVI7_ORYLA